MFDRKADKEMAEEYADSVDGYEIKTYSISDIEEAYLAGLKAGKTQWHNVADGDLPPLRKEVLWCVDKQLWLGELLESRIDFGEWELDSVLFNDYEITWKEIVLPDEADKRK